MATESEELQARVRVLEQEVAALRRAVQGPPADETPAERWERLLRETRRTYPQWVAGWDQFMEKLGIQHLEPCDPERLQQMIAEGGVRPEDNDFSRTLIEMRDE